MIIKITEDMIEEAKKYAVLSKKYTSRNHDFHEGGESNAVVKMYEGKIGEKAFREWLINEGIPYIEDSTGPDTADEYDFLINNKKIDVKTRTKSFHTRTLEMVSQFHSRPKDFYVGIYLDLDNQEAEIYGFISSDQLQNLSQIEDQGYGDNYVVYDNQLKSIVSFKDEIFK